MLALFATFGGSAALNYYSKANKKSHIPVLKLLIVGLTFAPPHGSQI